MDLSQFSNTLIQLATSSTGAVVGGIIAFVGVRANERKKAATKLKAEVESVCKALRAEIECLGQRYMMSVGSILEQHDTGHYFPHRYPVFEDYFTVYNSNAQMLGKIESDEVRTQIVRTYIAAKAQIDNLRANNRMLEELDEFSANAAKSQTPYDIEKLSEHRKRITGYASALKFGHNDLMTSIGDLIKRL